ncbi:MAG: type II toxin-antitoxin system VapC family toxin [Opitutaceae bacterium]|jgi:predicted nucleic acid-binding protein|nr:type II toxin-antitoxin system VapC family toxin [Opitutaceae bacterium]
MLFDTDVLIWCFRGDSRAVRLLGKTAPRRISLITQMELMQGARNKAEQQTIRNFLSSSGFEVLPLSGEVGHRAAIYVESHALSGGLQLADALIAATALECGETLCTGNAKHYRIVKELALAVFRPASR